MLACGAGEGIRTPALGLSSHGQAAPGCYTGEDYWKSDLPSLQKSDIINAFMLFNQPIWYLVVGSNWRLLMHEDLFQFGISPHVPLFNSLLLVSE